MKVCGVWIGAADDGGLDGGPYWVDLTASNPPKRVRPYGDRGVPAGTHFKVSPSCATGAVVTSRPANAATVAVEAPAADGRAAEILVQLRPAHDAVTINAQEPGGRTVTVTLATATSPDTPH
jgi:hypothetical protein